MIGFPGARRQAIDLHNGRINQKIICQTPAQIELCRALFPEGVFRAGFLTDMVLLPNLTHPHQFIFQDTIERDEWKKTFIPSHLFEHYARWEAPSVVVVGSRAVVGSQAAPAAVDTVEEWRGMNDKKLRSKAAEIGLPNVDPSEGKEMLIARMKHWLEKGAKV
jgi:hypothetical protein